MSRSSIIAALFAAATFPTAATADSIVFVKGGNVHVFDGTTDRAITSGGNWESASQADDGTIVAVRTSLGASASHTNRSLIRLTRTGKQIGGPGIPVRPDSSAKGPFDAKVSPDGQNVAFWKEDPKLSGYPIAMVAPTADATAYQTENYYSLTGHWMPFWFSSATAVLFRQQGYPRLSTWTIGDSVSTPWFGSDEQTPTQAGGDVSADRSRMVTVVDGAQELRLYELSGPPPAAPAPRCAIRPSVGNFASPSFSPSGNELAWEESDGIHVGQIRDIGTCDIVSTLAVAGGRQPDWGPAGAAVAPGVSVDHPTIIKRSKLASGGLRVKITCPAGCTAVARLVAGGRVVAKRSTTVAAGATGTVKLKATVGAGVKSARVKVAAAGDTSSSKVKISG